MLRGQALSQGEGCSGDDGPGLVLPDAGLGIAWLFTAVVNINVRVVRFARLVEVLAELGDVAVISLHSLRRRNRATARDRMQHQQCTVTVISDDAWSARGMEKDTYND
jgi:hypothetical protein